MAWPDTAVGRHLSGSGAGQERAGEDGAGKQFSVHVDPAAMVGAFR
jgi:hypothetical protein